MVTMAVYGIGMGANLGFYNIVIIDVMGVEYLGPVFGTTCFSAAILFLCFGPMIGRVDHVLPHSIIISFMGVAKTFLQLTLSITNHFTKHTNTIYIFNSS